tara:strand:+ start:292 stop:807 length:516 start_codon:yes stop_codon:yes gene_type:complete
MKKFLFFLLILPLIGCNTIQKKDKNLVDFDCPRVFFSSEDNIYTYSEQEDITMDNLSFKAELNNFALNSRCIQSNNIAIIPVDILIVVKPHQNLTISEVDIPIYLSLLDINNNVLETQYFNIPVFISKNEKQEQFFKSDIKNTVMVVTQKYNVKQIVIGFMLDSKKREFLD